MALPVFRDTDYLGNNVGATSGRQAAAEPTPSVLNTNYPETATSRQFAAAIDSGTTPLTAATQVTNPATATAIIAYNDERYTNGSSGTSLAPYDPNNYPPVLATSGSGLTASPDYSQLMIAAVIGIIALVAIKLFR